MHISIKCWVSLFMFNNCSPNLSRHALLKTHCPCWVFSCCKYCMQELWERIQKIACSYNEYVLIKIYSFLYPWFLIGIRNLVEFLLAPLEHRMRNVRVMRCISGGKVKIYTIPSYIKFVKMLTSLRQDWWRPLYILYMPSLCSGTNICTFCSQERNTTSQNVDINTLQFNVLMEVQQSNQWVGHLYFDIII